MKKRICYVILCAMIFSLYFPMVVHADVGPKEEIKIVFHNMQEECYVTLLFPDAYSTSVPWIGAWTGDPDSKVDSYHGNGFTSEIWQIFADYKDADGFYFMQTADLLDESGEYRWIRDTPSEFKILLYFPKLDKFVVSEVCHTYAFYSAYSVEMNGIDIKAVDSHSPAFSAVRSRHLIVLIGGLIVRIILTILIEVGIALLMGIKRRKELGFIILVNIFTQGILNAWLTMVNYYEGSMSFGFSSILGEMIVLVLESIIYSVGFHIISKGEIRVVKSLKYAFLANVCSCFIGYILTLVF